MAFANAFDALNALAAGAEVELQRLEAGGDSVTTHRRVQVRYEGSDAALVIAFGTLAQIEAGFEAACRHHEQLHLWQRARHQYYETISGGSGAGGVMDAAGNLVSGFNGTLVVQAHMTNSRLTDPEVLEFRFPVRLESYEIRAGSGGAGRWTGGNGGVRRVRFLEPMTASILSNGRKFGAFGMAGGLPGQVGLNRVVRADGRVEALGHIGQAEMQAGDIFEIQTPGGGGFGAEPV